MSDMNNDSLQQQTGGSYNSWNDPSLLKQQEIDDAEKTQATTDAAVAAAGKKGAPTAVFSDQQVSLSGQGEEQTAASSRYATLSQQQLDTLLTGDPVLLGTKGTNTTNPFQGKVNATESNAAPAQTDGVAGKPNVLVRPANTNTFFNPNPMVNVFSMILFLIQVLKEQTYVANKLAVATSFEVKDTGQATAAAIRQEGQDQAKSEYGQAFMAAGGAVAAGIGIAGMAKSTMGARAAFKAEQKAKNAEAESAENLQKTANKETSPEIARLDKSTKLKQARLEELRSQQADSKTLEMKKKNTESLDTELEAQTKKENRQTKVSKETESVEIQQEDMISIQKKKSSEQKAELSDDELKHQQDMKEVRESNSQEYAELETKYSKNDPTSAAKLQKDLNKDQTRLTNLKREQAKYEKEAQSARTQSEAFDKNSMGYMNSYRQGDLWYMGSQNIGQIVTSMTQAGGHIFAGQGAISTSNDRATQELMRTYQQMDSRALDTELDSIKQATQWVAELAQLLTTLSDREQQGMRWAA
jgi:hypothetical protein